MHACDVSPAKLGHPNYSFMQGSLITNTTLLIANHSKSLQSYYTSATLWLVAC